MKRTDWKAPVIIIAAFLIGILVNLAARQFLPGILPASMAGAGDLIAVVAQILVSTLIIFITVKIMHRGEDD